MLEKPFYFGLYKEGGYLRDGTLKDSPDYNRRRLSDIIQEIDQKQRLLYLEWDGSNLFIGVQFHCSSVTIHEGRPVRDSRRMYFEQIPYGKNDPLPLYMILLQFYQRAEEEIKSFYSERYDKIQMRLATSEDFNKFISDYNTKPHQSPDSELSKYFGGKLLSNERCTVLSSDFIISITMITDIFEVIKHDKTKIVFIVSELDNPNDTKFVWDFLIRIPTPGLNKYQNLPLFTYNADNHTFSDSSFTQGLYKLLYNYSIKNRSLIPRLQDSIINNFIQSFLSSNELVKIPTGELCKSKLGTIIAKEFILKKLQNNEKIDSDILKLVYTSLTSSEQSVFGRTLLDYDYDFPELYTDELKKILLGQDKNNLLFFISKDFPEYRNFQTSIISTFKKIPWDNPGFHSNARKILELILVKYSPDTVGEGGKIFTRLLYQTLSDHHEINAEFIQKYSEKMRYFDINIPLIPKKSLFNKTELRWFITGSAAFAAGILSGWLWFSSKEHSNFYQTLNGIDTLFWVLISGMVIVVLLLGYLIFKRIYLSRNLIENNN
jgi:hypothetical protein